ncbi:hypothetical protein, partial [Nitratifractor sp.]
DDFALSKDRIFLLVDGGITVIDRPTLKKLSRTDLKLPASGETKAIRVRRDGRLLLVNWGGNWLKAFRVNEDRIGELSTIREDTDVKDFSFVEKGRKLVLIDSKEGIMLYDLGDPRHPKLLDELGAFSTRDGGKVLGSGTSVALTLYNTWEIPKALLFSIKKNRFVIVGETDFPISKRGADGIDWKHPFALIDDGETLALFGGRGMKTIDTTLIDRKLYARSSAPFGSLAEKFAPVGDARVFGIVYAGNVVCTIDLSDLSKIRYRTVYVGDPCDADFFDIVAGPLPGQITLADQNQGIRIFRIEGERVIEMLHESMDTGVGAIAIVDHDHLLANDGVGSPDTEALALYRIRWKGKTVSFRRLGRIPLPGIVQIRYDARRRLAYVTTEKDGIVIARVTGKGTIERIGTIDQKANDLLLDNDRLFVASSDGVRIYSRSRHPRLEAFIPLPETALSLALETKKDRLFVGTQQGLYVYDLQTRHRLARYPVGRVQAIHLLPKKNVVMLGGMAAGVTAIDLSLIEE